MSVPLDRLYHFIEKIAIKNYGSPVIIYRFWPHGSKNIQDLNPLKQVDWAQRQQMLGIWCHDQEPLDYDFFQTQIRHFDSAWPNLIRSISLPEWCRNLMYDSTVFSKNLLVHSEQRSKNLDRYATESFPVYYWSHALIARDWFRYAKHEDFTKDVSKEFLIYNRAWSGTREYRLRFSDLLVEHQLIDHCLTFCCPTEQGKHYETHMFKNPVWRPTHVLENYFLPSQADSCDSADFDTEDYRSTEIEVVLETLFDDDRLHLTEKSLRPIACRQPFILAATHGSLQYLRDYGFKTFDSIWDETYDTIEDPYQRMQAIIRTMCEITTWSDELRCDNVQRMQQIVDHNHKHFFSKDFFDLIINELRTNMTEAFDQIKQDPGFDKWLDKWQHLLQFPQIRDFLNVNQDIDRPTRHQLEQVLQFIEQHLKTVADRIKI
jgi:hypothetical protein